MGADVTTRRAPPAFVPSLVVAVGDRSPRLASITLEGPGIGAAIPPEAASSLRLLLPRDGGAGPLELPSFNGNFFVYGDGVRPPVRTLTPIGTGEPDRLRVDVVRHGEGLLAGWLEHVGPGHEVGVSLPTSAGFAVDEHATRFLLAGDESAIPGMEQVLAALPPTAEVAAAVEVAHLDAALDLPVEWVLATPDEPPGDALVRWVEAQATPVGTQVWAAGEAAAVQRLRNLLVGERGLPRHDTVIRGYWKHGRSAVTPGTRATPGTTE
jgi:NADPH-dependent ferric siderophore reductase